MRKLAEVAILGVLGIAMALVIFALLFATASANGGLCPDEGSGTKIESQVDGDLDDIVLDAGTLFCVKAGNTNTGVLVADGETRLCDYLDDCRHNVSHYIIYEEVIPSFTPTPIPTGTPTATSTPSPTPTSVPTPTATATSTPTPTTTVPATSPTPTRSPSITPEPTLVPPIIATPRVLPPTGGPYKGDGDFNLGRALLILGLATLGVGAVGWLYYKV